MSTSREIVRRSGEPVWLIFESRHRKKCPFPGNPPGITPRWIAKSGFFKAAASISELARKCGIDEANLTATVQRFNTFVTTGVDEDFHRCESKYDRHCRMPGKRRDRPDRPQRHRDRRRRHPGYGRRDRHHGRPNDADSCRIFGPTIDRLSHRTRRRAIQPADRHRGAGRTTQRHHGRRRRRRLGGDAAGTPIPADRGRRCRHRPH